MSSSKMFITIVLAVCVGVPVFLWWLAIVAIAMTSKAGDPGFGFFWFVTVAPLIGVAIWASIKALMPKES
jgi:hypothetical protein